MQVKDLILGFHNQHYFKMCGGLFSFCFLHETVFGNGQVAITHNGCVYISGLLVGAFKYAQMLMQT